MYLLKNGTCVFLCPSSTYIDTINNKCVDCHIRCLSCWGGLNTQCDRCNNITSSPSNTLIIYYLLSGSSTCSQTCPNSQYIDKAIPNICQLCSSSCLTCANSSTNCLSCQSGIYFFNNTCITTCPNATYQNTTICSPCTPQCRICTDSTIISCTACNNITETQRITYYYKQPNTTVCSQTCPSGYLVSQNNNTCLACQNGCTACSATISNCSACTIYAGVVYYLDRNTNTCATVCPNAGSGNNTDFVCYSCQYFTFNQKCIQSCPTGYVGVIGNISTCVECSSNDTNCSKVLGFNVQTKVVNSGNSFEHKVILASGLSSICTPTSLAPGLSVSLLMPLKGRLLVQIVPLTVQTLSVSANGDFILIWTNSVTGDLSSSNISVIFRAGALISSNGIPYNQLASDMTLNNPTFMYSYIQTFSSSTILQAEGIAFILLSFILWLTSLITTKD